MDAAIEREDKISALRMDGVTPQDREIAPSLDPRSADDKHRFDERRVAAGCSGSEGIGSEAVLKLHAVWIFYAATLP
ncbi:hypothetical protein FHS96_004337 [Sphingomonas zeicaulis]|uniref:hypothetical protein n=1 Tax=Sphingomonas zeicaulis TaxID=1632740 RepID=UPI003D1C3723